MKFCTRADGVIIVVLYITLFVAANEGRKYVKFFLHVCHVNSVLHHCNNLLNKFVNKHSCFVT